MKEPRLLFLTHPFPNYVPDLLLHGLRKILGNNVVDFPRKDCLYAGQLGGLFPSDDLTHEFFKIDEQGIDREDIPEKAIGGYFDFIIADVRYVTAKRWLLELGLKQRLILIDGEDVPLRIPPGPFLLFQRECELNSTALPLPMALPEELYRWLRAQQAVNKTHSVAFLGSFGDSCDERLDRMNDLAMHYPEGLIRVTPLPSSDNLRPAGRLSKKDYYAALQSSHSVISMKGAGWDTFRFWENCAINAIHIAQRSPLRVPMPFIGGDHLLLFENEGELRRQIDDVLARKFDTAAMIERMHDHLLSHHLTHQRAAQFLKTIHHKSVNP